MSKSVNKKKGYSPAPSDLLFIILAGFAILFLPIFHLPSTMDEAMQPRLFASGIFALLFVLALWIPSIFKRTNLKVLHNKVFIFLGLYLCFTVLSLFFAWNPRQGLFDVSKTGMTLVFMGLFAISISGTVEWINKLAKMALVASGIALAIGIVQYVQYVLLATTPKLEDGLELIYAVKGLMFHKNEYTASLMLLLPLATYAAVYLKDNWKFAGKLVVFLLVLMIILLKTRSVWIGLVLGTSSVLLLMIVFSNSLGIQARIRKNLLIAFIAGGTALTVLFSIPKPADEQSLFGRLRSVTDPNSNDNIHRLKIWKITANIIKRNPVLGVGAGNWEIKAPAHFKGKFNHIAQLNWTRPHNDYLWVCSEKGIPGLVLYLAFFFFIVYNLLSVIRLSSIPEHKAFSLLMLGGLVAYFVVAFFNQPYERLEHQLMLAIFGAASVVMHHAAKPVKGIMLSKVVFLVTLGVLSLFTIIYGIAAISHESHIRKAIDARNSGNWEEMLNQSVLGKNSLTSLDPFAFPAEYYQGMALAKLNRHKEAIEALQLARIQSPNNIWIHNQMGQSFYNMGKYNHAQKSVEKVLNVLPKYKEALISLSAIYYQKQRYGKAYQALTNIEGWQNDPQIVANLKVLQEKQKEKQRLINEQGASKNP